MRRSRSGRARSKVRMISPRPSGRADWTGPKTRGDALNVENLIFSELSQIRETLCCAKSEKFHLIVGWEKVEHKYRTSPRICCLCSRFLFVAHPNCLFGSWLCCETGQMQIPQRVSFCKIVSLRRRSLSVSMRLLTSACFYNGEEESEDGYT